MKKLQNLGENLNLKDLNVGSLDLVICPNQSRPILRVSRVCAAKSFQLCKEFATSIFVT